MGDRTGVTELDGVDGLLVQATLEAVTVKVYVVPLASPSTVDVSVTPVLSPTPTPIPGLTSWGM